MLKGKTGVIFGVANKRSIAYAIARAAHAAGAKLALNVQSADMGDKVGDLVADLGQPSMVQTRSNPVHLTDDRRPGLNHAVDRFAPGQGPGRDSLPDHVTPPAEPRQLPLLLPCDVTKDAEVAAFFEQAAVTLGRIDFLVHSIAFAKREELSGRYADTSRDGFALALDVSAYSLVALARAAAPHMTAGGAMVALSYLGSERAVPNYNVMGVAKAALEASVRYLAADLGPNGIRVNAISAGPINTVSARGVAGFSDILEHVAKTAPLRRNVSAEDVADAAVFLLSDKARGITGEVLFVDAGYSIMGMQPRG